VSEDTNIDTNNTSDSATDSGTSDHDVSHHDRGESERHESVRDAIKSAWREQTGEGKRAPGLLALPDPAGAAGASSLRFRKYERGCSLLRSCKIDA
jgi:hypothetical protein